MEQGLKLEILPESLCVCKLDNAVPACDGFFSLTVTKDEISLICSEDKVPKSAVLVEKGFIAIKVMGQLDFGLVGILSKISTVLAHAKISIFALSTYDTDYILIKRDKLSKAIIALKSEGYII